ncbi:MAG: ASCH domain-containing protein [Caldimonas sp.]
MPLMPPAVVPFWREFCAAIGEDRTDRFFEAFHFDDNAASANALAALVLARVKRATAGLVWSYEHAGVPLPQVGQLSVVTDFGGKPLGIIETIRVDVVPYDAVSAEFAATEGEGDGSLAYWRRAHWAYFGRECARIGRTPSFDMPVACERFELIHPPPA